MAEVAESPRKRFREEETLEGEAEMKRQCSYHHILSILESEEEEPTQDLSSLITTLQQELSSPHPPSGSLSETSDPNPAQIEASSSSSLLSPAPASTLFKEDDEHDEEVIRHLLETSDGDVGVPEAENEGGLAKSVETFFCDGVWELEDEAANYNSWLQSELFM